MPGFGVPLLWSNLLNCVCHFRRKSQIPNIFKLPVLPLLPNTYLQGILSSVRCMVPLTWTPPAGLLLSYVIVIYIWSEQKQTKTSSNWGCNLRQMCATGGLDLFMWPVGTGVYKDMRNVWISFSCLPLLLHYHTAMAPREQNWATLSNTCAFVHSECTANIMSYIT